MNTKPDPRQQNLDTDEPDCESLLEMLRMHLVRAAGSAVSEDVSTESPDEGRGGSSSGFHRLLVLEPGPHETNHCGLLRDARYHGLEVKRHHQIEAGFAWKPDVVLVDATCRYRDNLSLIRRLRRADPMVRIVALAAVREDPVPYHRAGANDCLAIDFVTCQSLAEVVDRLGDPSA